MRHDSRLVQQCKNRPSCVQISCPGWPLHGFATIDGARAWVRRFVRWINTEHRHGAIRFVTPGQRHRGENRGNSCRKRPLKPDRRPEKRPPPPWERPFGVVAVGVGHRPAALRAQKVTDRSTDAAGCGMASPVSRRWCNSTIRSHTRGATGVVRPDPLQKKRGDWGAPLLSRQSPRSAFASLPQDVVDLVALLGFRIAAMHDRVDALDV